MLEQPLPSPSSSSGSLESLILHPYRDLYVVFCLSLIFILGDSSISPAFPRIAEGLSLTPQQVSLVLMIFTLPMIVAAPVLGILADRWGRKRVLIPCLILYGLAGSACAFAQGFTMLLVCRFLQGIGAATMGSLNLALLSERFPLQQRTAAMGLNSMVVSGGAICFPFLGGWLAGIHWRYPFLLSVLAFPVAALVLGVLRDPRVQGSPSTLKAYLSQVRESVRDRRVFGLMVSAVAVFALFFGAQLSYFPLLLGSRLGVSSLQIGLTLSCQSMAIGLTAAQLRWLSQKVDLPVMIRLAFGFFTLSMLATLTLSNVAPTLPWLMVMPAVLFGIGGGMAFASIQSRLSTLSPAHLLGSMMALYGMSLTLGQTLGPALMNLAYSQGDMNGVFGFAAALAAMMLLVLTGIPRLL